MGLSKRKGAERFLAAISEVARHRGDPWVVALVASSEIEVWTGSREWEDEFFGHQHQTVAKATVFAPARIVAQLDALEEDERGEIKKRLTADFESVLPEAYERLTLRVAVHSPQQDERWRKRSAEWLRGVGLSNQGRVRSDRVAPYEHHGLLYRSRPEIRFSNALHRAGLVFAPLPTFVTRSEPRIEPDFLIVKDGLWLVVEVDGDAWHDETPAQAHQRLLRFTSQNVAVHRIPASELASEDAADKAVDGMLAYLESLHRAR